LKTVITEKLARLREMLYIIRHHAADNRSRIVLAGCYLSILRSTTDQTLASFKLKICNRVFPFHMRRCDIFTIAEILYERQYDLATHLPEKPVIVDAGANIGVSCIWLLANNPGATLIAFEPAPDNFTFLKQNLEHIEGVTLYQEAIGDHAGTVDLHLAKHGAVHSIVDVDVGSETIAVPMVTLKDRLDSHSITHVDLLKLDVEGSELDVIRGLGDRLDNVGTVVGEVHEHLIDTDAFYSLLEQHGIRPVSKQYFGSGKSDGVHAFEATRTN
jgi:FkbM family methyltransferase